MKNCSTVTHTQFSYTPSPNETPLISDSSANTHAAKFVFNSLSGPFLSFPFQCSFPSPYFGPLFISETVLHAVVSVVGRNFRNRETADSRNAVRSKFYRCSFIYLYIFSPSPFSFIIVAPVINNILFFCYEFPTYQSIEPVVWIRGSLILNYGSGSGRPINIGSKSYKDNFLCGY